MHPRKVASAEWIGEGQEQKRGDQLADRSSNLGTPLSWHENSNQVVMQATWIDLVLLISCLVQNFFLNVLCYMCPVALRDIFGYSVP